MHVFLKRFMPAVMADILTGAWYAALVLLTALFATGDQPAFRYISL
jgi:hypothetical protein